jgi:hypothetical protein
LLELRLFCNYLETYFKKKCEITIVDQTKQHRSSGKEGVWQLEVKL